MNCRRFSLFGHIRSKQNGSGLVNWATEKGGWNHAKLDNKVLYWTWSPKKIEDNISYIKKVIITMSTIVIDIMAYKCCHTLLASLYPLSLWWFHCSKSWCKLPTISYEWGKSCNNVFFYVWLWATLILKGSWEAITKRRIERKKKKKSVWAIKVSFIINDDENWSTCIYGKSSQTNQKSFR